MLKSELEIEIASECLNDKKLFSNIHSYNLFTFQEVQTLVKRISSDKAVVQKYSLRSYSDGKLGFLGSHQRLNVEIKTTNGKDMLTFFVKTVPYDLPVQAEYVLDKCVFLKEKIFYRDIIPQLYHDYKGEPWTATCFLVKKNLLLFEDLSTKGYSLRNKLFNKELIVSSLTSIAKLHACSLLAEARLGKSLKELYPQAFVENAFSETGKTSEWFDVSVNAIIAIAKHLNLDASLIPKTCKEVYAALKMSSIKKNVISHGDLWGNNLMFSNSVPPKCLLIDFQLIRYSPLAHDVVQLLYLCTDRDFRVTWEETMLKHYYSVLCDTLNSTKTISVEIPAWSELIEGIEEQRLAAIITAAIYFQTVLLDEKLGAEILGNPNSYHEFEFKNRNETVLKLMEIDPIYNKRLTEIVTELVEFSFRLNELPKPT